MPKIVYSSSPDRKIARAFYVCIYICILHSGTTFAGYIYMYTTMRGIYDMGDRGGFHWLVWVKFSPAFERFEASINNRERQEEQHSLAHNRIIKLSTLIRDSSLKKGDFILMPNLKNCPVKTYLNAFQKLCSSSRQLCMNHINVVQPLELQTNYDYTSEKGTLFSTITRTRGSPSALSSIISK